LLAFERTLGQQRVRVLIQYGRAPLSATVSLPAGSRWRALEGTQADLLIPGSGRALLDLSPQSLRMYALQNP